MKLKSIVVGGLLVVSTVAMGEIRGVYSTAVVTTPPVAVSMGNENGVSEDAARLQVKNLAETWSHSMSMYDNSQSDEYPYSILLKEVGELCKNSKSLVMEGKKITYDLYTSLVDGNSYVTAKLEFKYKCPELSRP